MTSTTSHHIRLALLAAAAAIGFGAAPVHAQAQADPGADVADELRALAESPDSLSALKGAAEAALAGGDPEAAVSFFARAEEIAPRDGRIKAGIAAALLQMEQAEAALKFFAEATALGVPDAEIAADRGLAYDLSGNPARAQLDYALVLRKGPNPEVTRRLALSKAISGDREGALKLLDPQLREQDRAAWRARAFVLALTGDTVEATEAVQAVMPAYASQMRPFLATLPSLTPAQRAQAVHFGHFPEGGAVRMASAANRAPPPAPRPEPARQTRATPPSPAETRPARRASPHQPVRTADRRREPEPVQLPASLIRVTPRERSVSEPTSDPVQLAEAKPQRRAPDPEIAKPAPKPVQLAEAQPRREAAEPARIAPKPVELPPSAVAAGATLDTLESSAISQVELDPGPTSFADVAAAIAALPTPVKARDEADKPAAKPEPKPEKKAEPVKEMAAKKAPAKKESKKAVAKKAEPKDPSRHWVQIAGGADKAAMPAEFKRLKGKAPKLLASQSAWTTPLNATNRLLVGPFKTEKEAQAFVNELAKADLSAFSWTSAAGQEIEKLAIK